MTTKPFKIINLIALYSFLIVAVFFIHRFFVSSGDYTLLNWCYGFNGVFTLAYLCFVSYLGQSFKHQIGFVFLGFATFKIFAFIGLKYYKNFEIETAQFLIFFLPYFFSILFEILITKKILDHISFKDKD